MKKIYMILAAMSLLTLSLNAQVESKASKTTTPAKFIATTNNSNKPYSVKNVKASSMSELLSGIKGFSNALQPALSPVGSSQTNGQTRAPLKINSDEYTVGPFTGDNFNTAGIGYPNAYGTNGQSIYITTDLTSEEFSSHIGDEIVGFRLALAGETTQSAFLYDFIAWPFNDSQFDQDNMHTWSIAGTAGITAIEDIVITVSKGTSTNFSSITVYDQGNNVLTSWDANNGTIGGTTNGSSYYNMPDGWTLSNVYMFQYGSSGSYIGYLSTSSEASITISSDIISECSSFTVVINGYSDNGTETLDVNGDTRTVSTTSGTYTFNLTPTTYTPSYIELAAGQWHEFYLDEPVVFNVSEGVTGMRLGYVYYQFPSSVTDYLLYPIAVNPESTSHSHHSYRYGPNGTTAATLTGWNYDNDGSTFPSTWTVPSVGGSGSVGGLWFSGSSGGSFTIPASDLQDCETVTVKIIAGKENSSTHTISVNNSTEYLTESMVEYTWENIDATNGITINYSDYFVNISSIQVIAEVTNYDQGWWNDDYSQYGDLAVQLIFKNSQEKSATPTITSSVGDTNVTITATSTDPTAEVTLVVDGVTYTGTGSVSATVARGTTDKTASVTATAQEQDKAVSDPATAEISIPHIVLEPTDPPTFTSQEYDYNVGVTASGNGTIKVYYNGQLVTNPYFFERLDQDYTVIVTATAQENGKDVSTETTYTITIPARTAAAPTVGDGWTELPTYENSNVIDWGELVMFVDRFTAFTGDNDHKPKYTYYLKEEKTIEPRKSNSHIIPVMQTGSAINGYYTEADVIADTDREHVKMNVMNAAVNLKLEQSNEIYYYTLDRSKNSIEDENFIELSELDNNGARYVEMHEYFTKFEPFEFGIAERFDNIDLALPVESAVQGDEGRHYGEYGTSYMAYVPIVWTFGNDVTNTRHDWGKVVTNNGKNDTLYINNSYGSPIWKTGVGMIGDKSSQVERQNGVWSTWTTTDGTECSLFRAHLHAKGYLPNEGSQGVNVDYQPYMFRVWVVCDKLRAYTTNETTGRLEDAGAIADNIMWLADIPCNCIDAEKDIYDPILDYGNTGVQSSYTNQLVFGATNDAMPTFYVRFYYRATGKSSSILEPSTLRADGESDGVAKMFYGVDGTFDPGDPSVAVNELHMNNGEIESQTYYNALGMKSNRPFDGVNIIVTRYTDGTVTTTKVIR